MTHPSDLSALRDDECREYLGNGIGFCRCGVVEDGLCETHLEGRRRFTDREWERASAPYLPDDRGGLQCLRHYLAGWPGGQDCPCVAGGGVR